MPQRMHQKNNIILGIESSCDDTSAAVLINGKTASHIIANQEIHIAYGGVVPELASRAHQKNIIPVVEMAIKNAKIEQKDITAIAYTKGPGLMGSLLVGASFAKSMSMALGIPLIPVHHMQAHILVHFIESKKIKKPAFPFLALTISGGHTQIVLVRNFFDMEIIGETLDDAVGEAFDKCGKMLGLDYPAGILIDKYAQKGNPYAFSFPKPKVSGLHFSFSGLKTAVLRFLQKNNRENPNFIKENLHDICASIQHCIVGILMDKLKKATDQTAVNRIALGGGVSANSGIRTALEQASQVLGWEVFLPPLEYTTDNGAMIAITGHLAYLNQSDNRTKNLVSARLKF